MVFEFKYIVDVNDEEIMMTQEQLLNVKVYFWDLFICMFMCIGMKPVPLC